MKLSAAASFLKTEVIAGDPDLEISGIQYDSRKVKPGDLFVCIAGTKSDGHDYIEQVIDQGAAAIVVQKSVEGIPVKTGYLLVDDTRVALARLASLWFGLPSRKMNLIGVTGTNGKTTTTYLIKGLLEKKGQKVGLLGTVNNLIGEQVIPSTHTTPGPWELAELLKKMVDQATDSVVMEVSSHALKQHRVDGCEYDAAVFTNLTQDHLDYHDSWQDYLDSKLMLFRELGKGEKKRSKYAVVNVDDPAALSFISAAQVPVWTYGVREQAMVKAEMIQVKPQGTFFTLVTAQGKYPVQIPLIGKFNVYNTLAAVAVALAEEIDPADIVEYLKTAPQVPGRFELVNQGQPFTVIVDYAHTPDGLENILKTAREVADGRLITVFGCGGDRDRTKRPIMGRISGEYSTFSVITSDNPRTENPESIIAEIEKGLSPVNPEYKIMEDRRNAIKYALQMAKAGDLVMIAGKGHENYQLVNGNTLHFDDREVAQEELALLGYRPDTSGN